MTIPARGITENRSARGGPLAAVLLLALGWSAPARSQSPSSIASVRERVASVLNLRDTVPLKTLSEAPLKRFSPNAWQAKGMSHSSMYRATVDGQSTLIKTFATEHENKRRFRNEVFAIGLASGNDGPRLLRAGKFVDEAGATGYFVQMEELFPGSVTPSRSKVCGTDLNLPNNFFRAGPAKSS